MNFDITKVPFSSYGSYIAFSHLTESWKRTEGLYLRTVHTGSELSEVFRIELTGGNKVISFHEIASPALLTLETEKGSARICIPKPKDVRVSCIGVGMRLSFINGGYPYDYAIPKPGGVWEIVSYTHQMKFMLTPVKGEIRMDAPWGASNPTQLGCTRIIVNLFPDLQSGVCEFILEEFKAEWAPKTYENSFDDCLSRVQKEFTDWLNKTLQTPHYLSDARELAAYVNWSCVVEPEGKLTRPAMFMSKNWMISTWSWDNCFNAMALVEGNPELAWEQLGLLIDAQDKSGVFPDKINDYLIDWSFCKPPVHGWALKKMIDCSDYISKDRLKEIYTPLCNWTKWWFTYRDDDHDGIPQYNHGNDSGWDNSTVFNEGCPVESPDLAALLIIQMEVLAEVAVRLDKEDESRVWGKSADTLLEKLLAHSWKEDRFIAPKSGSHETCPHDSLLVYVPIVLGRRLPGHILRKMVDGLTEQNRFMTEHGIATESVGSPSYLSNGYWSGPIWAPATMLIVDGLSQIGEERLALDIVSRFCATIAQSGCMAENYGALTGEGLNDQAYTWTSSVFLLLANQYLNKTPE